MGGGGGIGGGAVYIPSNVAAAVETVVTYRRCWRGIQCHLNDILTYRGNGALLVNL